LTLADLYNKVDMPRTSAGPNNSPLGP